MDASASVSPAGEVVAGVVTNRHDKAVDALTFASGDQLCEHRCDGGVLGSAGSENVQGEVQKKLDIIANEVLLEANEWGGHLAAMASEEMDSIHVVPDRYPQGEYLLLFDLVDYALHRAQHHFDWWWQLHAVHHSQRQMTMWSDNRNHLLDDVIRDCIIVVVAQGIVDADQLGAVAGLGCGRFLGYQVAQALAEGRLVRLLGEYEPPPLPIHLLYPHARLLSPRVRCLVDWIVPRLRGMCVELAGERGGRDGKPT